MRFRGFFAAALLAGAIVTPHAKAHDFWIQPQAYWSQAGASVPITLQLGHGAERQRSRIRSSRIARVVAFAPDGAVRDVHEDLQLRGASDDGHLHFDTPGTHVLVLETHNRGRSALPAQRFNKYAREEGLNPALERRTDSSGRARFSLTRSGDWLLNVVWTQPVIGPSEVDFDTIFSSLTFGFP